MSEIKTPAQTIEYDVCSIKDIKAEVISDPKTGKKKIESVTIGGRPVQATPRFWNSLYARFGFSKTFFNYFTQPEVFERISLVNKDERLRVCYQTEPDATVSSVLAVSNPLKAHLPYEDVIEILKAGNPTGAIDYAGGILRASYMPRGETPFIIAGDEFEARFDTLIPIDGYGKPNTVLGTYRMVCTNGLMALSSMFSNNIPTGSKDTDGGLARIIQTLESYGNGEGYAALRSRLESARQSHASVSECSSLSKAVIRALSGSNEMDKDETKEVFRQFQQITGNFVEMYGLVNDNAVGKKRLSTLPSRATIYDLINFGTEIATHHVPNEIRRREIQGMVGEMLSGEYDLEGSAKGDRDYIDVFINADRETSQSKRESELQDRINDE